MVIDQPIVKFEYFDEVETPPGIPSMMVVKNKTIETMSIESDNYIGICNHLKKIMELVYVKDKFLMVYEISIFNINQYLHNYNYNTRIRYAVEDLGFYGNHLLDNYKKRKKRREIVEYYNPKNAMTFKQYVEMEMK